DVRDDAEVPDDRRVGAAWLRSSRAGSGTRGLGHVTLPVQTTGHAILPRPTTGSRLTVSQGMPAYWHSPRRVRCGEWQFPGIPWETGPAERPPRRADLGAAAHRC